MLQNSELYYFPSMTVYTRDAEWGSLKWAKNTVRLRIKNVHLMWKYLKNNLESSVE